MRELEYTVSFRVVRQTNLSHLPMRVTSESSVDHSPQPRCMRARSVLEGNSHRPYSAGEDGRTGGHQNSLGGSTRASRSGSRRSGRSTRRLCGHTERDQRASKTGIGLTAASRRDVESGDGLGGRICGGTVIESVTVTLQFRIAGTHW